MTWLYICVVAFMVGTHHGVRRHSAFTGDSDLNKPQKRTIRAPRVGGLAVASRHAHGPAHWCKFDNMTLAWLWPALFVSALPVFVADARRTSGTSAPASLLAAFASARRLVVAGRCQPRRHGAVDYILSYWPVSWFLHVRGGRQPLRPSWTSSTA